jgi:hypothetical protein
LKRRQKENRLLVPLLAFLVMGLMCLPGLIRLLRLPWVGQGAGDSGAAVTVELTASFFLGFFSRVGLADPWLRGLMLTFMGLGLAATLYRRRWQAALFSVLWIAVPFVVLSLMKSPRPFEERYVIFVPPVALLLAGAGVVAVGEMLGALGQRWNALAVRRFVTIAISLGLVLLFVTPLQAHYAANRSEARLEHVLSVVERQAHPGDVVIISPRTFVRPLAVDGAQVLYLTEHLSLAELDDLAQRSPRMWIVYTTFLPTAMLQEPLDQWVQAHQDEFALVPIKAPTGIAYANMAALDSESRLKDRVVALEQLVQGPAGKHGRWVRYGILADTYQALGDLYADQGNTSLAEENWLKAEETRAKAPPPW